MKKLFEYCDRDERCHAKYLILDKVVRMDYYDDRNRLSKVYMSDGTVLELTLKYASDLRKYLDD